MRQHVNAATCSIIIFSATVVLFAWGRWRHDIVAISVLLACVVSGFITPQQAFLGFGHPAVITVVCVLMLSYGLQRTGIIEFITQRYLPQFKGPSLSIAFLTALSALLSSFMNNVGALAMYC